MIGNAPKAVPKPKTRALQIFCELGEMCRCPGPWAFPTSEWFDARKKRLKELTKKHSLARAVRIMRADGNKITSKWVYDNWDKLWPQGKL
jgi:hypothetical protein